MTGVFRAREGGFPEITDAVRRHVPEARSVLEVGCGTGELSLELASVLEARVLGIDLEPANVALAEEARAGHAERVAFRAGDYLELALEPVDLIVMSSTLHLIRGATERLVEKLARDLVPGGLLVATLPFECAFNSLLFAARRAFRVVRSRPVDALVLAAGKLAHPREPTERIRERVPYMYVIPERLDGETLRGIERAHGLELVEERPIAHASLAQPRHRLTVLRRR